VAKPSAGYTPLWGTTAPSSPLRGSDLAYARPLVLAVEAVEKPVDKFYLEANLTESALN